MKYDVAHLHSDDALLANALHGLRNQAANLQLTAAATREEASDACAGVIDISTCMCTIGAHALCTHCKGPVSETRNASWCLY
jgi:hypothetical protein